MKPDPLSMTLLLDQYGGLLTEKQRLYLDLYCNQDLSLAEIAENEGISRQGVHDALTRAEQLLQQYEKTLGAVARTQERRRAAAELRQLAAEAPKALRERLLSLCDRLDDL